MVVGAVGLVPLIVPTGMCSNTGKVPSAVGAAGTPVLPGEVRTVCPALQSVSSCGTFDARRRSCSRRRRAVPGERVGEQRVPDHRPGDAVDGEPVGVLEGHHRAAGDWFGAPGLQSACSSRGVFG